MRLYLDTSAVIRLLVDEDGSGVAAALWDRHPAASSVLVRAEARAALAAALRAGRLTAAAHRRAVEALQELLAEMTLVSVDDLLAQRAGDLAQEHGLCGYDATHLATAIALGVDVTILVTWDKELADAALRTGLVVAP